jgi:HK97 family phage portal protein
VSWRERLRSWVGQKLGATYQAWDDFWYSDPPWGGTASGEPVNASTAIKASGVVAGVRVIAESIGMMPLVVYRRREDDGRERLRNHWLWRALHDDQPNPWQTSQEFIEMMTAWALLWGFGLAEVRRGAGRTPELWPIPPDAVPRVYQARSGRLVYEVWQTLDTPEGQIRERRFLLQDDVLRLGGLGLHTYVPLQILNLARESIGLWLAMEQYGARFFSQGARPGIVVESPKTLDATGRAKYRAAIDEAFAGRSGHHRTLVLDEGATGKPMSRSPRESQMLEEREFQVRDLARYLRVPEHMLATSKSPTFASIEQFGREFVDYSLMPWAQRWAHCVKRDLITQPDVYIEFLFDSLLRGDTLSRYRAHQIALGGPNGPAFKTRNEVRKEENLDPVPNGDVMVESTNIVPSPGKPPTPASTPTAEPATVTMAGPAALALRREIAAIRRQATAKHLQDGDGWRAWTESFYARHAAYLSEMLQVPLREAQYFVLDRRADLLARGLEVVTEWEAEGPRQLAGLLAAHERNGAHV